MASGRAAVLLVALGGRARRSKFQAPTTAARGTSRADERGHRTRAPRPKVGQSARSPEFNIVVSASGQCDSWRSLGTDVRCFLDGAELEKIQGSGPVRQRVPAPARRAECEGSPPSSPFLVHTPRPWSSKHRRSASYGVCSRPSSDNDGSSSSSSPAGRLWAGRPPSGEKFGLRAPRS